MLYMTCMQTRIMVVSCFEVLQLLATPAGTGCSLPWRKLRRRRRRQRRRRARCQDHGQAASDAAPGRRQGRSQDTAQVEEGAADRSGSIVVRKFGHYRFRPRHHLGSPHRLEVSGEDRQGCEPPAEAGGTAGTPGAETPCTMYRVDRGAF